MNKENTKKYINLPPFKGWVLENFPFIEEDFDAITNYQMMCKIIGYLNVIKNNNDYIQNEEIKPLYDAFVSLKEYVDDYFENLDVQEEINNKLDEMAESGDLAEIIAEYVRLNAIFSYNTVSDMANAENLQDGASVYCLGKLVYNDGIGSFYKIRELRIGDVIDGDKIVAITNSENLVAEKLPKDIKNCIIAFDTKADLKNAEYLLNGYFAKTYGNTSLNDGICYFYKIRTKTNDDVIDELNILALTNYNDLVAERICEYIPNDLSNPIYYGADPTGTNDSTDAINNCILANKGGTVNFSSGNYVITESINLPYKISEQVNINGNGAKLIVSDDITRAIYVGYDKESEPNHDVGFPSYIDSLNIDASTNSCTYGIDVKLGYKDLKIYNCTIYRVNNGIRMGDSTGASTDILVKDCLIYGKGSEYDGTGCLVNGDDNNIVMSRIYGFRKGFVLNGAGTVDTCQVLLRWENQTMQDFDPYERNSETFNTYYEQTMFADVNTSTRFLGCYADSTYKYLEINTEAPIIVTGSTYYNSRENCNCSMFNINVNDPKLTINDTTLTVTKNNKGEVINTNGRILGGSAQVKFTNINIVGIARMTNPADLILTAFDDYHSNIGVTSDTWYLLGIIANNPAYNSLSADLYFNSWRYFVRFTFGENGTPTGIAQQNRGSGESSWTIGLLQIGNNCYVCFKSAGSGDSKVGFDIKSANRVFKVTPVKNNSTYSSIRLLSDYTNLTPTQTFRLNNVLF